MGVRLFASAREAAGAANDVVEADTVGGALAVLRDRYGADFSAVLETARVWVNGDEPEMGDATPLHDGDELAVLPPVSGGSGPSTSATSVTASSDRRAAADSLAP